MLTGFAPKRFCQYPNRKLYFDLEILFFSPAKVIGFARPNSLVGKSKRKCLRTQHQIPWHRFYRSYFHLMPMSCDWSHESRMTTSGSPHFSDLSNMWFLSSHSFKRLLLLLKYDTNFYQLGNFRNLKSEKNSISAATLQEKKNKVPESIVYFHWTRSTLSLTRMLKWFDTVRASSYFLNSSTNLESICHGKVNITRT